MAKAVIFDFDGVLVDSERHWDVLFADEFHTGLPGWNAESAKEMAGRSTESTHLLLRDKYGVTCSLDEYLAIIDGTVTDIYRNHIRLMDGLTELLVRLETRGMPMGIATSSEKKWIDDALGRFGIDRFFTAVVTANDVPGRTKPCPDPYQLAARRLDVPVAECLAIEDSANGIASAKAAGMACVGLLSEWNTPEDLQQADAVIPSLEALTDELIASLFAA